MKKTVLLSATLATLIYATEDLGVISINSTTIDDKFKSLNNEVSSVSIIDDKKIEQINPQNIVEVLNSIPGITAMQTEGDIVKLHIRGVDNQVYMGERPGVAVVIDGVPVQETTGKINIDLDNIETIKVIKGAASYLYGNDALSGAVVITTKRPRGENYNKVETETGSFGYRKYLASTTKSFENSALQMQASYRKTDGYWDRAFNKNKSFSAKYNYYIDDSSDVILGFSYSRIKSGDGSGVHGVTAAKEDPESKREITYASDYDTKLTKSFITYSKDFENDSNLMFSTYRYTDDKSYESAYEDIDGDGYDEAHDYKNDEQWEQSGLKTEYRFSFDKAALMLGLDIQRNNEKAKRTPLPWGTASYGSLSKSSIDTDEDINAVYAEFKYELTDKLTSTLNFRYDDINYDLKDNLDSSQNVSPSFNESSYRAGLNYALNQNTNIYTNFSTAFRAPTASQISSNSADGYTTNIDPEKVYNYEIGIRGKTDYFNYEMSVYQLVRKDYIGMRAGNYIRSSDEDNYYDNVADMRSRGFELALNGKITKKLSFNLAYTYLNAEFTKNDYKQLVSDAVYAYPMGVRTLVSPAVFQTLDLSNNQVPRTPRHTLHLTLNYKPIERLTLSPELIAKSKYFADETNDFEQAGYALVNLRSSYKISKNLELFGRVDNLLDKDYYQFVHLTNSRADLTMEDASIIVGPSRAYYAGLRYKF
ncbi:TonB-dependent receptor [Halarcobacter anaerophilus]|uniref:TonB-dependent receptor n=1 Tax=Halarcobacter anaerophilus TaxID=877500 RepID=A0A4Q0XZM5_9BACT|nr:TonB-dependent receptor [Halarcobacter anaerophilus]QDF30171.1 TonB-dependent receptor [Halarcobacter anaerophilus]RXJ62264.1 TonB-dependent receptor [Halarcobacter anaerophilus]